MRDAFDSAKRTDDRVECWGRSINIARRSERCGQFIIRFPEEEQHLQSKPRRGAVESCCHTRQRRKPRPKISLRPCSFHQARCALCTWPSNCRVCCGSLDQHHDDSIPTAAVLSTAWSTSQYDVHMLQPMASCRSVSQISASYSAAFSTSNDGFAAPIILSSLTSSDRSKPRREAPRLSPQCSYQPRTSSADGMSLESRA
jgi:hypothetical protein